MGNFELVRLTISEEAPQKLSLQMKPITPPVTPPDLSPGVEYLSGSPFGGNKTISKLPSDPYDGIDNDDPIFSVPCRIIPPWVEPEGSGTIVWTIPQNTLEFSQTAGDDSTVHLEATSKEVTEPIWPPLEATNGTFTTPWYTTPILPVPIDDFLSQQLFTDMVILNIYWAAYPGFHSYYLNVDSLNLITTSENNNPYGIWPYGNDFGVCSQSLKHRLASTDILSGGFFYTVYSVPLFMKGGYGDYGSRPSDNTFDCRSTLLNAIYDPENTNPFISYLRRCLTTNEALHRWLEHLANIEEVLVEPVGRTHIYASLEFVADNKRAVPDYSSVVIISFTDVEDKTGNLRYVHGVSSAYLLVSSLKLHPNIRRVSLTLPLKPETQALGLYAFGTHNSEFFYAKYPNIPVFDGYYWVAHNVPIDGWYIGTEPPKPLIE